MHQKRAIVERHSAKVPLLDPWSWRRAALLVSALIGIESEARADGTRGHGKRVVRQITAELRDRVIVVRTVVILDDDDLTERSGLDQPPPEAFRWKKGLLLDDGEGGGRPPRSRAHPRRVRLAHCDRCLQEDPAAGFDRLERHGSVGGSGHRDDEQVGSGVAGESRKVLVWRSSEHGRRASSGLGCPARHPDHLEVAA